MDFCFLNLRVKLPSMISLIIHLFQLSSIHEDWAISKNYTNKWSHSFSTLILIEFFPFISFFGLFFFKFIYFLVIYFPSKLGRGKRHQIVARDCTISPSQLLKRSLQGMWKQLVRSCTVRLFTKWTRPHLRFSDCPRKYASGSQFDSFCLSGVCKSPSWSRAVFASGVDV